MRGLGWTLAVLAVGAAASGSFLVGARLSGMEPSRAEPSQGARKLSRDRIYLTPAEIRQTYDRKLWPGEVQSLLKVGVPLSYGTFVWNEDGVPTGNLTVRVDLSTQLISVFRAGHEIGTAVILFGADSHRTPLGTFPIRAKLEDNRSRAYGGAPMPYTLQLTPDGVAIHGSEVRGGVATHGCIGVPLKFARLLFEEAHTGDAVMILRSPVRHNRVMM